LIAWLFIYVPFLIIIGFKGCLRIIISFFPLY
jgi:hypothetical protein